MHLKLVLSSVLSLLDSRWSFCLQDKLRFFSLSTDSNILRTFFVNYDGSIILLRPLTSSDNFFNFQVRVTDDRTPNAKSDDADVRITINHVKFSPMFQGTPYTADVRLDRSVSSSPILTVRATDRNLMVSFALFFIFYRGKKKLFFWSVREILFFVSVTTSFILVNKLVLHILAHLSPVANSKCFVDVALILYQCNFLKCTYKALLCLLSYLSVCLQIVVENSPVFHT